MAPLSPEQRDRWLTSVSLPRQGIVPPSTGSPTFSHRSQSCVIVWAVLAAPSGIWCTRPHIRRPANVCSPSWCPAILRTAQEQSSAATGAHSHRDDREDVCQSAFQNRSPLGHILTYLHPHTTSTASAGNPTCNRCWARLVPGMASRLGEPSPTFGVPDHYAFSPQQPLPQTLYAAAASPMRCFEAGRPPPGRPSSTGVTQTRSLQCTPESSS
ncbi:hypothetical protein CMQ_280 [Grosmannia clavigera kw1407]|uniref:Uncharacterized protein n=1 Tax=Grosmannia clavigera (strain kw1407 / UAMH 11150) TaxID=655863 RepID=F0XR55_GROCL|nr:uncharacterized protein CMQ_280 [Grosmannia clavigera kw1407]EFW99962.1 hypothetical protein CMQ_280 [Grosmannia clavigera kw1407]